MKEYWTILEGQNGKEMNFHLEYEEKNVAQPALNCNPIRILLYFYPTEL